MAIPVTMRTILQLLIPVARRTRVMVIFDEMQLVL